MKELNNDEIESLVENEIAWCEAHRGGSDMGDEWEDGFIEGLKQVVRIMDGKQVKKISPERK